MSFLQRYSRIILIVCILYLLTIPVLTSKTSAQPVLDVYFFYSETCPHCAHQEPLMQDIDQYNEDIDVHFLEVSKNQQVWQQFREEYSITSGAVPRTFIGESIFVGYSGSDGPLEYSPPHSGFIGYRNQIIQAIAREVGHEVRLSTDKETLPPEQFPWIIFGLPILYMASFPWLRGRLQRSQTGQYWWGGLAAVCLFSLFLGVSLMSDAVVRNFAQAFPFPVFIFIIALVDGFNPCAFTVLIILLSLLTYTRHRRDMILIGGTFILTSAIMYLLFILGLIGAGSILFEQYGSLFLLIVGIGIVIAGIINVKDYFFFKLGFSLSLSAGQQRIISHRAGQIVRTLSHRSSHGFRLIAALGSTVALASFVNIIELGCTAILPAVYMAKLVNYCPTTEIKNSFSCYIGWTSLYAAIYIIPLVLILSSFIYSFRSSRMTEDQGRVLKLVSGLFMLFFGLVMIFQPTLLMLA